MQSIKSIPAVWVHTTLDSYNTPRPGGYPAFLSADEQARLERIRQGRMLFDGRHREYFLDEGRTQFDFPPVRAGTRVRPMYLTYNVLGLISLKSADLLFGQEPIVRVEDDARQAALDELMERTGLHQLLYAAAVDASYEGECFLETCAFGGKTYLKQLPADEMFPLGPLMPDGQYASYARRRVKNVGDEQSPVWLLAESLHLPGRIERRCFQLDDEDGRREVELKHWGDESLSPLTLTGLSRCNVTWIPNLLVRGRAVGDYDGAVELQDALNAKNSQVGRVLLKHSDPRMAFPEEAFDGEGGVRADHDVFAFNDPARVPQYITWNAELEHAMRDRAFILNQLLVRTETSPVLLGLKEGAAPDAFKKVRLESFNSLTKARRKAAFWKVGVRRALETALELESRLAGERYERGPIAVQLRDGIPDDARETAERLATLRAAGLISLERAVEEQLLDPGAARKELGRLR